MLQEFPFPTTLKIRRRRGRRERERRTVGEPPPADLSLLGLLGVLVLQARDRVDGERACLVGVVVLLGVPERLGDRSLLFLLAGTGVLEAGEG